MSREEFKVIPPLSLVEITKVTLDESAWKDHLGRVFRIGYYSEQDGLDCVWLVDDAGEYREAVDQAMIRNHIGIL
jgi:hypothetical protein